jgi:subtilisin family serine protease
MDLTLRTTTFGGEVNIFDSAQIRWVRGAITLDASKVNAEASGNKRLKAGMPIGKITATGKYSPVKKTTLAAAAVSTDTTLTLVNAKFLQNEQINVNGTNATIQSINYDTNVVTLTAAIGAAKAAGDNVKATDGSGDAVLMLGTDVLFTSYNANSGVSHADQVATAFDEARVIEARLPFINDLVKADLKHISFK